MLGRPDSAPTHFKSMMNEIAFGTYNTKKKIASCVLNILDAFDVGDLPRARGLTMQTLRWLILDLEAPKDPQMSWRLTYLPDPIPMVGPQRSSTLLDLNSSVLNPQQLTATMGLVR